MTVERLYQYMKNPSLLSEKTLSELEGVLSKYPYFQAVRMLYLKNLALVNDDRLDEEIKKMSVYFSDRKKLYTYVGQDKFSEEANQTKDTQQKKKDTFSLIDNFLTSNAGEEGERLNLLKTDAPFIFEPTATTDYLNWSLTHEAETEQKESKLECQDLIDSFIQGNEERLARRAFEPEMQKEQTEESSLKDVGNDDDAGELDDSYFTETLAWIYIKQRRYEKALQIIRNLSLKYPEKNVYFADQIRFLEKLIINIKK